VGRFKYWATTLTNYRSIEEEIKGRLLSGNACWHSVQSLPLKNVKIKIYRTIILPVLYGCETWSPTLRNHRLRVFENRVLRRIFGPKRDEVRREWRRIRNEELYALYSSPSIIRVIKSRIRRAGQGM
jgi:hypothetical protein